MVKETSEQKNIGNLAKNTKLSQIKKYSNEAIEAYLETLASN